MAKIGFWKNESLLAGSEDNSGSVSRKTANCLSPSEAALILRAYEDSCQGWFWATDKNGRITYVTERVGVLLTDRPEDIVGSPLVDLFLKEDEGSGAGRNLPSKRATNLLSPQRKPYEEQMHSATRASILACITTAIGCAGQKADDAYTPQINHPAYGSNGPSVCMDEAHNNSHTATGLYRPFADLLEKDGYRVHRLESDVRSGVPSWCTTVVVVNAAGGKTYKLFGLNLPTKSAMPRPLLSVSMSP